MYPKAVHSSWFDYLDEKLLESVKKNLNPLKVCPEMPNVFRAFSLPLEEVNIVVIGQSPYPTNKNASGLCFGIPESRKGDYPYSLQIIANELAKMEGMSYEDFLQNVRFDPTLQLWKDEGVLMLNSSLTCEPFKPNSHKHIWFPFIKNFLQSYTNNTNGIIFWLIGSDAQELKSSINEDRHFIFESIHPAALRHNPNLTFNHKFKEINSLHLKIHGYSPKWYLPF